MLLIELLLVLYKFYIFWELILTLGKKSRRKTIFWKLRRQAGRLTTECWRGPIAVCGVIFEINFFGS